MAKPSTAASSSDGNPGSLLQLSRAAVLKETGIDQSEEDFVKLNLPRSLVKFLKSNFGSSDFTITKEGREAVDGLQGDVYKVKCLLDGKIYMLKKLSSGSDEVAAKVLQSWGNVKGDGIQKLICKFADGQYVYYVLEYLQWLDSVLQDLKKRGKTITEDHLWQMIQSLSSNLQLLHEARVSFPDLQPGRIGINQTGQLKLGNAILYPVSEDGAMNNLLMDDHPAGVYTPPEIIVGEGAGPESDVWRLGAVIYEAAALAPAYPVDDTSRIFEVVSSVAEGQLPSAMPSTYSDKFKSVVNKCLSPEAKSRPTVASLLKSSQKKGSERQSYDFRQIM